MAKHDRYPPEVHEYVKKWAPILKDKDLASEINRELGTHFTAQSLRSFRKNHGYIVGYRYYTFEQYVKYQTAYPPGMPEFIMDNSWGHSSTQMAELVNEKFGSNISESAIDQFRRRWGIKSGVTGRYEEGHTPENKGKKQTEFMSPEAIERSKAGRFKKGQQPKNTLPVGAIVKNTDGFLLRKKQMEGTQWERWEFLHHAVWEEHRGPIPEGMMVTFLDKNKENCSIENLALITLSENAVLNSHGYRSEDPDITRARITTVRIKSRVKEIRKSHEKPRKRGRPKKCVESR